MPATEPWSVESLHPRSITLTASSAIQVAWLADDQAAGESLWVWTPERGDPQPLRTAEAAVAAPALASGASGTALLWARSVGGSWSIELIFLEDGRVVEACSVPIDGVPGRLDVCATDEGFLACWEQLVGRGCRIGLLRFERGSAPALVPETPAEGREPCLAWDGDVAWLALLRSPSSTTARRIELHALSDGRARLAAVEPVDGGRVGGLDLEATEPGSPWLAWHTDRRPGREPELTRWIEVRCLTSTGLRTPAGRPLDRRWGVLGEDQGLEFPRLVGGPEGRLTIFGRSSHRHWRSDLGAEGWSSLSPLDAEGWGCRSRRVPVSWCSATGELVYAHRVKQRVQVELLAPAPPRGRRSTRAASRTRPRRGAVEPRHLGPYRLCFGDLHQHTAHSDGTGTVREVYERARERYGDDLCAVTDHESFLGKRIGPGEWARFMAECDAHDEPGRFVTLPGSSGPAPDTRGLVTSASTGRGPTCRCSGGSTPRRAFSAELVAAVGRRGGLVFPHHVGWTGADVEAHDPGVQTCWEVVSCHGAYEALGVGPIGQRDVALEGQFLRDQLDAGHRFGLVGGSDGHGLLWHHGVSRKRDSHRTGLTALFVRSLDRAAVFEALRRRRCYATSGVPIRLWFEVDGALMGSEVAPRAVARVEAWAEGVGRLRRADLIGPRGWNEPLTVTGSSLRVSREVGLPSGVTSYLYLRVEQADGEVAWSSPVFFDR